MKKTRIKVVIFDLCGVLIDVKWKNLEDVMRENDVKIDKELFKKISNEVFTLHTFKTSKKAVEVFLERLNDTKNDKLRKYQVDFLENWGKLATPNKQGMALFNFARFCGLKTAILSNVFPVKDVWKRKWGLTDIDHFFFSYENGVPKPDKQAFTNVCNYFKVKPSECLIVGDSMNKDIIPATKIGMKTIYWTEFCSSIK